MFSTFLQEVEGEEPGEVADGGGAGGGKCTMEEDERAAGGNLQKSFGFIYQVKTKVRPRIED